MGSPDKATVTIEDSDPLPSNPTILATINGPSGIDYHPVTNALIVSRNDPFGSDKNFKRVSTNGVVSDWTGLTGLGFTGPPPDSLPGEVKVGIVQTTTNGWIQGDMYFGTGVAGKIGKVSADGTSTNTDWATLNGEPSLFLGGFYIDQSGIFGGNLIVVSGSGGVYRVGNPPSTNATKVAQINDSTGAGTSLEGVLTVPNLAQYGLWAGKILTCAESLGLICAVDVNGNVSFHNLGLRSPEDVRLIPSPVKNLYAYPFGDAWNNGVRSGGGDYWFREGIVVPEPSTIALLCLGAGMVFILRKRSLGRRVEDIELAGLRAGGHRPT